ASVFRDRALDLQPVPEAHLLDREIAIDQCELVVERDGLARAELERLAQEVAQAFAHAPRTLRVRADERVDRVERVEQEVRIELRAHGTQLGLARRNLERERLLLD